MALIDLQTDLKSLKFGVPPSSDRPGGGNSGQPYIKKSIERDSIPQSEDFLLRGGIDAPLDAVTDVVRLSKYFSDLKSPNGMLFIAKQNLLSRTGVATQASDIIDWKNAPLNEGVYTPLNTLAQAGVGFMGGHFNKQGILPNSLRTYSDVVKGSNGVSIVNIENNRLVNLYKTQIPNQGNEFSIENPVNIYSYSGGPNSNLGLGKTHIKFATDNKGAPLLSGVATKDYQSGLRNSSTNHEIVINGLSQDPLKGQIYRQSLGVSNIYLESVIGKDKITDNSLREFTGISQGDFGGRRTTINSVYVNSISNPGDRSSGPSFKGFFPLMTNRERDNNTKTLSQQQIIAIGDNDSTFNPFGENSKWEKNTKEGYNDPTINDFKTTFIEELKEKPESMQKSTIMSISPSYQAGKNKTIEGKDGSRIGMTSPGQQGNLLSYTAGKTYWNGSAWRARTVDKVNAQPIYHDKTPKKEVGYGDLIDFRIGVMYSSKQDYIDFRAYIDNFSDSYNASWNSQKYMGRGEEFYKYNSFSRKISLGFTVAAQSRPELMAQYKKLNYLASTLAPTYTKAGYMGGTLVSLTMGGWCYELPGFISDLSLSVENESPWEIGIDDKGDPDENISQLPHIIKVSGLNFTPIHTFRPEKQFNKWDKDDNLTSYGPQQYIALANQDGESLYNR